MPGTVPVTCRRVSPRDALGAIARRLLGANPTDSHAVTVGSIRLHDHQQDAVVRVRHALETHGIALLADEVGLGKTFVAIAIARAARNPVVVAPAALRDTWAHATDAASAQLPFISHEALSRADLERESSGGLMTQRVEHSRELVHRHDLIIIDEAHHARTVTTHRYHALAALCRGAQVLMLSATPIHNSPRDLAALFALVLGERAMEIDAATLAQCIVRRSHADVAGAFSGLPVVQFGEPLPVAADDAMLEMLVGIPPALPPSDAGDAPALATLGLLRQWASSDGALRDALRRRLARGEAMRDTLFVGRRPSRADLAGWVMGDDAVQLAFPELLSPLSGIAREWISKVESHIAGVRRAMDHLRLYSRADVSRANALLELRHRHPGERIVAFTSYGGTVRAIGDRVRATPGVATLSALGARVAGGRLTRREVLERFAPRAHGRMSPDRAHHIDLLITTDLLSEGVNLQDASVVVHLDIPWTPARLEQRVGRVARIGSAFATVHCYTMSPPASADAQLRLAHRIREKRAMALAAVGGSAMLPPWFDLQEMKGQAATNIDERIRALLAEWRRDEETNSCETICSVISGERDAWMVVVEYGNEVRALASIRAASLSSEPALVLEALDTLVEGARTQPQMQILGALADRAIENAIAAADHWWLDMLAHDAARPLRPGANRARAARCAGSAVTRSSPHRRAESARRAAGIAARLDGRLGAAEEAGLGTTAEAGHEALSTDISAASAASLSPAAPQHMRLLVVFVAVASIGDRHTQSATPRSPD